MIANRIPLVCDSVDTIPFVVAPLDGGCRFLSNPNYTHHWFEKSPWTLGCPNVFVGNWAISLAVQVVPKYDHDSPNPIGNVNVVLSYSYVVTDFTHQWRGAILPRTGYRLKLSTLLSDILYTTGEAPSRFANINTQQPTKMSKAGLKPRSPEVYLFAHDTRSVWSALFDREQYQQTICGSWMTNQHQALNISIYNKNRNGHSIKLHVRDSLWLAPEKQSDLSGLEQITTTKLIKCAAEGKPDLEDLKANNLNSFLSYSLAEAAIPLEYCCKIAQTASKLFDISDYLPLTVGAMGVAAYKQYSASQSSFPLDKVLGYEEQTISTSFGLRSKKFKASNRIYTEGLINQTYHGGMNVAYERGYREKKEDGCILDVDFSSAYPSAMACLGAIDWQAQPIYGDIFSGSSTDSFPPDFTFVDVNFTFPPGTVFPCLPVASRYGIVYPLEGQSLCCGPEIALAQSMGAEIRINASINLPMLRTGGNVFKPFAAFMKKCVVQREQHEKGTIEDLLYKLVANSLYGKISQGIKKQRMLDQRGNKSTLAESDITNSAYASMTTSIVRAALCGLVDIADKYGLEVMSATTDGAMMWINRSSKECTGKSLEDLFPDFYKDLLASYPIQLLVDGSREIGKNNFLEIKHIGDSAQIWKTRMNIINDAEGNPVHIARGGLQADQDKLIWIDNSEDIEFIDFESRPSMKKILEGKVQDYITQISKRKANMDYDYKRLLLDNGKTVPFQNIEHHYQYREAANDIRKSGKRADYERVEMRVKGCRVRSKDLLEIIKRKVLNAVVTEGNPWNNHNYKYSDISTFLECTVSDVKNAKRRFSELLPDTPFVRNT